MKKKLSFLFSLTFPALSVLFFTGCFSTPKQGNNHLEMGDLLNHFERCGVVVDEVRSLRPDVPKASEGMAFRIKGRDIGVYKYDINKKKQKAKVEKIKEEHFVYLCGLKYPAIANGSFIIIDYNGNKDKKKIIEAFKSFKPQQY